jgi:hypothetical protein
MTPGELITDAGDHALNAGRRTLTVVVQNTATGRSRSARTTTSPRPTARCSSTAARRAACA